MPEDTGAETYLSDLSDRDKPWDVHRSEASAVQALYEGSEFDGYSSRISLCSRLLEFAIKSAKDGEQRFKLKAAKFCRVRYCPVCQWRRSRMWVARALQGMPRIESDYPKARWIFLTLTVKNCELTELRGTVTQMNKSFARMTQRKAWPGVGWARSLEVTRNAETREAHPHFHVLVMVKPSYFSHGYLKHEAWREMWQECLRADYLPMVNVKTVKPKASAVGDLSPMAASIQETFKYAVKPDDLVSDSDWLHELTRQLHKTRSINIGGVLKNYWSSEEPENLINAEEEEEEGAELTEEDLTLRFGWRENVKRYAKERKQ